MQRTDITPAVRLLMTLAIVASAQPCPVLRAQDAIPLRPDPEVLLGVIDGARAEQFHLVRDAILRGDTLVVADGGSKQIRFFDTATGRHIQSVGQEGEGPGEFKSLWDMYPYRGDSIAVWDATLRRVTVFDARGNLGRTLTVTTPGFLPRMAGTLPGGEFIMNPGLNVAYHMAGNEGVFRDTLDLFLVGPEATDATEWGSVPGGRYAVRRSDGRVMFQDLLFTPKAMVATNAGLVATGVSDARDIQLRDPEFNLESEVTLRGRPRVVTGHYVEALTDAIIEESIPDPSQRSARRAMIGDLPTADSMPLYDQLLVSAEGSVWVRRFVAPEDTEEIWYRFGFPGARPDSVAIQPGRRVLAVSEDRLVLSFRDDLDVEYVGIWHLNPREH